MSAVARHPLLRWQATRSGRESSVDDPMAD
jgi:hypothetical protein